MNWLTLTVSEEVLHFALAFCRIGAAVMVLPIFGERYVNSSARLAFALATTLVLHTAIPATYLAVEDPAGLATIVASELVIGLFIGATVRLVLAVTHLAGGVIAMQSGLASAAFFDPAEGTQSSGIGNFLTMIVLVVIVVSDSHHMMLKGLGDSYAIMPRGGLPVADMADLFARLSALAFETAIRLAAPLLVVGIMINIVSGAMNKLMPTFQVMFVVMPLQIALAFGVMMLALFFLVEAGMGFFLETLVWLDAA